MPIEIPRGEALPVCKRGPTAKPQAQIGRITTLPGSKLRMLMGMIEGVLASSDSGTE